MNKYLIFCLLLISTSACFKSPEDPITNNGKPVVEKKYNWTTIADSAQVGLSNFWNPAGKYYTVQLGQSNFNGNYWPNAHALDVLVDAYLRKNKDPNIKKQMDDLVAGLRTANSNTYLNYYYDDMQWLMISSLRAFQATGDARYQSIASTLWTDVQGGWDSVSGGGFYWRKDRQNKNTPANAPACIYAARAYQLDKRPEDLEWAKKTYKWLKDNMIRSNGEVWDGLNTNQNPITPDTRLFTYNYGTVIGSALEMYKITKDLSYQNDAILVADGCLAKLTVENILRGGDLGDGGLFNGIFVRYLTRLIIEGDIPQSKRNNYINFLKINGQALWDKGTEKSKVLFGPNWSQNVGLNTTLTPQLSGTMLMENLAELKTLNLL
jgi:predicted alpha-1,6-mannanase (GH76 family)